MAASAGYRPHSLLLQWHLTERCNLCCDHCYQDSSISAETTFADWLSILDDFMSFAAWCRCRARITLTGGEPLVHCDFARLMERLTVDAARFSVALLTNGTLVDAAVARRLRDWHLRFVQVSIDGDRATHDNIRGAGAFDRAVAGLECLARERVPTMIAFTARPDNFRQFPTVARLGREIGVDRVWADRMIPLGRGADMDGQTMTAEETHQFVGLLCKERGGQGNWRFPAARSRRTEITANRALQFHCAHTVPYHCTAGDTLIAVMPNGDIYPCRRMPIRAGNLLETPLAQLYYGELFTALRDRTRINAGCESCLYAHLCRGGLRCLSFATTGDPFRADPGCWLATSCETPVQTGIMSRVGE